MPDEKPKAEKTKPRDAMKRPATPAAVRPSAAVPNPFPTTTPSPGKQRTVRKGGRDIGLGVSAPAKVCQDPKCPFHGSLRVRGSIFDGSVVSAKMKDTVVVERRRLNFVHKYERFESRTSRMFAHNPPCIGAQEGANVRIAECRPLSKKVSFCVVAVTSGGGGAK